MPSPERGANHADEIKGVYPRRLPSSALRIGAGNPAQAIFKKGGTEMGDKGKKDKGKREQQKKAQLGLMEKRKLKKEKKKNK
jgi:hypothetical protein